MAIALLARRPIFGLNHALRSIYRPHLASLRPLSTLTKYLVSPEELHKALGENAPSKLSTSPKTIPVCGSWFLPNDPQKRTGLGVFQQAHVPSAQFFDLDAISDTTSPYPHMLPSATIFRDAMRALGIQRDDVIVVYDTAELGIFSAPRVAWTFKIFGHPAVHILNNFKLWVEQGYPVEQGAPKPVSPSDYPLPELDGSRVIGFEEVKALAQDHNKEGREEVHILDARSEGRWKGTDPEPRPGLSSGHIPGSISVPVPELLHPTTKAFKTPEQLRQVFQLKGIDPDNPIISSCGTGVTATVIDTALIEAGYDSGSRRVYDGSWTEWAQRVQPSDNLIVKSE